MQVRHPFLVQVARWQCMRAFLEGAKSSALCGTVAKVKWLCRTGVTVGVVLLAAGLAFAYSQRRAST